MEAASIERALWSWQEWRRSLQRVRDETAFPLRERQRLPDWERQAGAGAILPLCWGALSGLGLPSYFAAYWCYSFYSNNADFTGPVNCALIRYPESWPEAELLGPERSLILGVGQEGKYTHTPNAPKCALSWFYQTEDGEPRRAYPPYPLLLLTPWTNPTISANQQQGADQTTTRAMKSRLSSTLVAVSCIVDSPYPSEVPTFRLEVPAFLMSSADLFVAAHGLLRLPALLLQHDVGHPLVRLLQTKGGRPGLGFADELMAIECAKLKDEGWTYAKIGRTHGWPIQEDAYGKPSQCSTARDYVKRGRRLLREMAADSCGKP